MGKYNWFRYYPHHVRQFPLEFYEFSNQELVINSHEIEIFKKK